jgi:hypothetical protein
MLTVFWGPLQGSMQLILFKWFCICYCGLGSLSILHINVYCVMIITNSGLGSSAKCNATYTALMIISNCGLWSSAVLQVNSYNLNEKKINEGASVKEHIIDKITVIDNVSTVNIRHGRWQALSLLFPTIIRRLRSSTGIYLYLLYEDFEQKNFR